MQNHEHGRGSQERRHNAENKLGLDYFDISADLIDDLGEFAVNLNSDRPPTSSEFNFSFFDHSLSRARIPKRVAELQQRLGQLDEIQLNYTHHSDDPYSHYCLRFEFANDNNDCATLTILRPGYYRHDYAPPDTLVIVGEQAATEEHVEAISTDDINQCIASLIYHSKNGDFSFFSAMNLNDGERYEDLMTLFQKHSDYFVGEESYDLFADDETKEGALRYVIKSGDLITTELQRIDIDELVIEDSGAITHMQKILLTEIDLSDGTSIKFKKQMTDARSGDLITEPYTPQRPDYDELFAFIKHHNSKTNPIRPVQFNDEAAPYTDTAEG